MALGWLHDIIQSARRLGMKYPQCVAEVRDINNAITRMQPKILNSHPAQEPMAPPV